MKGSESLKNVGIGLAVALIVFVLFYLASSQIVGHAMADTIGGSVYTFVLALIISLGLVPKLTSVLKKRRYAGK